MPESNDSDRPGDGEEIPAAVLDEVERLTRLAREAVDENEAEAYREERAALLNEYDFRARVREDESRDILVVYPAEWLDDGLVQVDRIDDVDRGIERPLSGPGEAADWSTVDAHNRAVAAQVEAEHGAVHGETANAFAAFMSNHRARPIESATATDRREFREEYFVRNAWPSDEQGDRLEESVRLTIERAASITDAAE